MQARMLIIVLLFPTLVASAVLQGSVATAQSMANQSAIWVPMGPSPIENCDTGSSYFCSGRVTSIVIDPKNPNTVYIGAAQGGVWKSIDDGASWIPLTDDQPTLAVGSIAIAPNGDVYVGTGEGNNSGDSYYGAGILKTTDGGKTWTRLGESTFRRSAFTKLLVNPNNPNNLFAATVKGHTASTTVAMLVDPLVPLGVHVSSDGGSTWTRALEGDATDLVFDPANPSKAYAGVNGGIYVSTNSGTSWTSPLRGGLPAPENVGRISLGISASSPLTVFAALEDLSTDPSQGRLYRSTDGGSTWSLIDTPRLRFSGEVFGFCGDQCDYDMYIAVDPSDPNLLYLGGLDLFRSTDGGSTWIDMGGYAGHIHPDQHALAFSPTSHTKIYVGNDGGVWASSNSNTCSPSSCWTNLNMGLSITQFQSLAAHPNDRDVFFGGTQDNGSPLRNGVSSIWTQIAGGDGGWAAFDPSNPSTMYHTYTQFDLERSDNGGASWVSITRGLGTKDKSLFYVPMAIDPTAPSTLYLGSYRLYKTTNKGNSWSLPSPGLSFASSGGCSFSKREDCISAIAVAPSNGAYVYAGTNTGKFFVSTNGGRSFTEIDLGLPQVPVTKIAVDAANPSELYVTLSGFGNGHVFHSQNAGALWEDISGNLPDRPTNAIVLEPKGKTVYVGTDNGVYSSVGSSKSWATVGKGFPLVAVTELVFAADGTLTAATHGRGVWAYATHLVVSVSSQPTGAGIAIDGTQYTGDQIPTTLEWDLGSTHTLQVTALVQGSPGVRYVFTQWNDGSKDLSRIVTVTNQAEYVAMFKTQYELKVISDLGSPQGSGWYDGGTVATFSVTSPQPEPGVLGLLGGRLTFQRWTGDSIANSANASITMDGAKTVQATWVTDNTQPYLIVAVFAAVMIIAIAALIIRSRSGIRQSTEPTSNVPIGPSSSGSLVRTHKTTPNDDGLGDGSPNNRSFHFLLSAISPASL